VLSFIIVVDPGRGKETWKVEKLYSDVLGLDQRIRASVGKGVGKKIASLPEGKLWRDHAPAKVDQRKVSNSFFDFGLMLMNLCGTGCTWGIPADVNQFTCEEQRRGHCVLLLGYRSGNQETCIPGRVQGRLFDEAGEELWRVEVEVFRAARAGLGVLWECEFFIMIEMIFSCFAQ
jgi:hypothetical protein